MPTDTDAEVVDLLATGDITPVGRIVDSSNGALLCSVARGERDVLVIHKLEAHERPLWDYPDGTLVARERAAYLVSAAGGFDVVPPTVLREGPLGHGSLQLWVGPVEGEPDPLVDVTAAADVPDGWVVVVEGETPSGAPVVVCHSPEPALRTVAVLDAVINNSDRKGGHLMRDGDIVRGCDHGVSLSVTPKLRTVLWGWAGQPLPDTDLARVADPPRRPRRPARRRAARAPHAGRGPCSALSRRGAAAHAHPPAAAAGLAGHPVAGPVTGAP